MVHIIMRAYNYVLYMFRIYDNILLYIGEGTRLTEGQQFHSLPAPRVLVLLSPTLHPQTIVSYFSITYPKLMRKSILRK